MPVQEAEAPAPAEESALDEPALKEAPAAVHEEAQARIASAAETDEAVMDAPTVHASGELEVPAAQTRGIKSAKKTNNEMIRVRVCEGYVEYP